jgi:hypothetical protein
MMIHLETLMTWSLTALTAREVGHMFLYESAVFSPFGDVGYTLRARPVPGQAPLRCAKPSVSLSFAPQKTKASLTTFAHTKAFVMSVCSHALAQKTKPCTKACFMVLRTHVLPPSGPVPWG